MLHQLSSTRCIHLQLQGKFLHLSGRLSGTFCIACSRCKLIFPLQMVALNFKRILLMLKDGGSIPRDTLQSQDGINLGVIHFCPLLHMLCMQCLSLDGLCTLLTEGAFAPPRSKRPPKLSGMTAILLVFQADSRHEKIINVYMGLMVRQVHSCPSQIHDFIKDIEGDLQEAHNALKAGGDPGKRRAYCLFVDNLIVCAVLPCS